MPICPNCRSEYRAGISRCADCQVDLVDSVSPSSPEEIQEEMLYKTDELVELADFANISEAAMIQELLTANNIETALRGQSDQIFAGALAKPVSILVEKHNLEAAQEIYEAYFAGQETCDAENPPGEQE